jgi:trans-aconitate 2-methyltransferase
LARIEIDAPERVVDLGCGTGQLTAELVKRWPGASVTGVDSSPEMLAVARAHHSGITWRHAELSAWAPALPVDVLYSNASLHWLADHGRVFPELFRRTSSSGILAVQMPRNFAAPSHTIAHELARSARWSGKLGALVKGARVAEPEFYYDQLAREGARVELWETEYIHALTGVRPVLEWVKGTSLRPFLAALDGREAAAFEDEYAREAALAYPPRADGVTLFPFRRLFLLGAR